MIRKIIQIDEEKCNGCGLCATACHEGAIGMVAGKAKLLLAHYCDGLGDCLPACPMDAISFVTREAPAYDEQAVLAAKKAKEKAVPAAVESQLRNWPVQLKLAPLRAPFYDSADLLIAADCSAYAYGNFHRDFIRDRVTLIGCPKLDAVDYSRKLMAIFQNNDIRSITVVRMEVPCCGGIEYAVRNALEESGKTIPCRVVVLSTEGEILPE
jgi:ferredoxin